MHSNVNKNFQTLVRFFNFSRFAFSLKEAKSPMDFKRLPDQVTEINKLLEFYDFAQSVFFEKIQQRWLAGAIVAVDFKLMFTALEVYNDFCMQASSLQAMKPFFDSIRKAGFNFMFRVNLLLHYSLCFWTDLSLSSGFDEYGYTNANVLAHLNKGPDSVYSQQELKEIDGWGFISKYTNNRVMVFCKEVLQVGINNHLRDDCEKCCDVIVAEVVGVGLYKSLALMIVEYAVVSVDSSDFLNDYYSAESQSLSHSKGSCFIL